MKLDEILNESMTVDELNSEIDDLESAVKEYKLQKNAPMVLKYETLLKQAREKRSRLDKGFVVETNKKDATPSIKELDETLDLYASEVLAAKRNFEFLTAKLLESQLVALEEHTNNIKLAEIAGNDYVPTKSDLEQSIKSYKDAILLYRGQNNLPMIRKYEGYLQQAEESLAKLNESAETVRELDGEILGYEGAIKEQRRRNNARMVAKYEELLAVAKEKRAKLTGN